LQAPLLLSVRGIAKSFGALRALADGSFDLRAGELLGIIGPNGAGKTTLLECASGVRDADGGTVTLDGAAVAPRGRKETLFFLPDGATPWPSQRVGEVLEFVESLFGSSPGERAALGGALGIAPLLAKRVGDLSRGQRKRVLVAIALLTPQPFLLLDEPFDGLDLRQQRDVAAVLRAQAARGRGLCLSIHQLADAARLCDRLVLLADGRTVGSGTLDELRARAGLRAAGIEEVFLALT
jgi:ABC-type multidrug transport system ATPase subunit